MPILDVNGCRYYYEEQGSGADTIVFSHGLLWSGYMFHKQVKLFKHRYRVVTYDHRGQGASEVTPDGYDMDSLYEDAVELLEQLQLGKVHFVGLSMGGFVGMRLAARRPDLVQSLILMETSAQDEPNRFKYQLLNTVVKLFGIRPVIASVMKIMFGQKFLTDPNRSGEVQEWTIQLQINRRNIVRAVQGVIERRGVEKELNNIVCPTLIMVGTQDVATVPSKAEFLHDKIRGSKLQYIEGAGHTSCIEEPGQVNRCIDEFLAGLGEV